MLCFILRILRISVLTFVFIKSDKSFKTHNLHKIQRFNDMHASDINIIYSMHFLPPLLLIIFVFPEIKLWENHCLTINFLYVKPG